MKKLISWGCIFGSIVFISSNALADGDFKLRAGLAKNSYGLDVTPANSSAYSAASASYTGTNFGVSYIFADSTYVDLAVSNGNGSFTNSTLLGDGSLTRSDFAAIYGMNSPTAGGNATNLYLGYKSGTTALVSSTQNGQELDFSASGFVLGGGWIFPLKDGEYGAIGLTGGIGLMNGQYTYYGTSYKSGGALGAALGLGYTLPITQNFGVSFDYKYNSYTYTYNKGMSNENSMTEKVASTVATLWLKF